MTAREYAIDKHRKIDEMVRAFCSELQKQGAYLGKAPNNATPPYTTFSIERVEEESDKSGLYGIEVTVRYDMYDVVLPTRDVGQLVMGDDVTDDNLCFVISDCYFADMQIDKTDTNIYYKSVTVNYNLQHIKL